jgi:hypothetical protein
MGSAGSRMDLQTVFTSLNKQLDKMCPCTNLYCPITHVMDEQKQTSALLEVCWHSTEELDSVITAADKVLEALTAALVRAVALFKAGSMCFTTDKGKLKEIIHRGRDCC